MSALLQLISPVSKLSYQYTDVARLLPPEYKQKIQRNDAVYGNVATQMFIWLVTQAGHFLDPSCANVFKFIIARTYGYRKPAELMSVRQLIEGVWDARNDGSICAPVVKDERTARKALDILERIGFITRTRITINRTDVLSCVEVHAEIVLLHTHTRSEARMLRQRRKDKRAEEGIEAPEDGEFFLKPSKLRGVQKCSTRHLQKCSTNNINKEDYKKNSCSVPRNVVRVSRVRKNEIDCKPSFDKAKDAVAEAVARVTEKREAKVRRAARATGFISLSDLNATWQSVMVAAFGSCTMSGMTHKEYGIFKRIAKTHTLSCSWKEFLGWVVQNWSQINNESKEIARYKRKQGDWSLKDDERIFLGSESPDLFMMAKNFSKLVKRFSQHTLSGRSISAAESEEVERLKKEVQVAKHEAAVQKHLNKKLLNARPVAPVVKQGRQVARIIQNPEDDDFFDSADSSLPEWK